VTSEDGATPRVVAVARSGRHTFTKLPALFVRLVEGHGVEGDAHAGATVKHRSRVAVDPTQPNLRQVHLIASERLDSLAAAGFRVSPGLLGENLTTSGVDLFRLSTGTRLALGSDAEIEITGLRNPCIQLDRFQTGLMAATLGRGPSGEVTLEAGVMAIVTRGGEVRPGDSISMRPFEGPHRPLRRV
jgi:MOSC domain-containing protein YiiM